MHRDSENTLINLKSCSRYKQGKIIMAKMSVNSGKKEMDQLLTNKVANMPLDINRRLHAIVDNIEKALSKKEQRISSLLKIIDKKYPPKTVDRGLFDAISMMNFDTAYSLYLLNNNSALIVELQGILERCCINALNDILPIDNTAATILNEVFEKKTLNDVAPYFEKYNIWEAEDTRFAKELTNLRNGIAHKNAEVVSRSSLANSNGQSRHFESIHTMMSKVDCAEYLVHTIELIIKVMGLAKPSFIDSPRMYARYSTYGSLIGELYNLFLTNPYAQGNNPLLETYINERLARTYIIGSNELVEKLEKYRIKVIQFHKALSDNDEERILSVHKEFAVLLPEIVKAMRNDLQVDNPNMGKIKEPSLVDIKPYLQINKSKFQEN